MDVPAAEVLGTVPGWILGENGWCDLRLPAGFPGFLDIFVGPGQASNEI